MHPRACLPSGVRICILALIALGFFSHGLFGQVGREFPELKAKDTTYRNVRVISRSPVSITVRHSGGIAQVPLKDLPVEIQADFGFVSEDAEAFEERLRAEAGQAAGRQAREIAARASTQPQVPPGRLQRIADAFGTPPEISGVDMRPRFKELEFFVKDQGRRPSCAVFAVVSALELQNAEIAGRAEKLSEEYLIWATLQMTGSRARIALDEEGVGVIDDAGFSLLEVLQALGRFGIPTQDALPNHLGPEAATVAMPQELIEEAKARRSVVAYAVPGRDSGEMARNIIHVLNNGVPVILAMKWPHSRAAQGGLLSSQEPSRTTRMQSQSWATAAGVAQWRTCGSSSRIPGARSGVRRATVTRRWATW